MKRIPGHPRDRYTARRKRTICSLGRRKQAVPISSPTDHKARTGRGWIGSGEWWATRAGTLVLALAFAVPLLLPTIAPLADLPTHMARYHVGDALAGSPGLQRFFSFEWRFMPNLGMDLLVFPLAKLIGLEAAVRVLVSAIPALAIIGMLWIAREAHRRPPATVLFALPLAMGFPVTYGFVNYCLAVSLSLIAFGYWLRLSNRGLTVRRDLVFLLIAPIILTAHIVGFAVLGALCGGSILGRELERRHRFLPAVASAARASLPLAWPILILVLWRDASQGPPPSGWLDWQTRALWFMGVLREQWALLDLLSAAVVYGVGALPLIARGRFAYAPQVGVPALILWAAALLLPPTLVTQFASVRLIYVAAAVTVLAVRPRAPMPQWVTPIALAFVCVRLISSGISLIQADRQFDRELTALNYIAPGSLVMAFNGVECARAWAPNRQTGLPSIATVRRDAFINQQFITAEGQLLTFRPDRANLAAYRSSQTTDGPCARYGSIARPLAQRLGELPPDTDYLWFIGIPANKQPAHSNLRLMWRDGDSALYKRAKLPGDSRDEFPTTKP